jgi:uncharacterized protein
VGRCVRELRATRVLVAGRADAAVLALSDPLSFWGGLEPATGEVTDVHHPQHREVVTGRVVVMASGRGSSSSSSVLAEAIRAGTAPAAIVLAEADPIVALGAVVAEELYGLTVPVVEVGDPDAYAAAAAARRLRVDGHTLVPS